MLDGAPSVPRRRGRRWRSNRRGVVSVIGTLLALLVFFALFGIFLTQYLPLWMTDNESAFTSATEEAMATLQSNINFQIAAGGPPVLTTPFTMASQGVPLLAAPTQGILTFNPSQAGVFANVSMTVGPGGSGPLFRNFSLGSLSMNLPNRYYSSQLFEFEDDAVIQSQSATQQIVAFPPLLSLNTTGTAVSATLSLVQLYGNASQAISTGTQEIASHYLFSQSFTSTGPTGGGTFNAEFKLGTHFPCAWAPYLGQQLNTSLVPAAHYTLTPNGCSNPNGLVKIVDLKLVNINAFTLVIGTFSLVVGVGVE